MRRRSLAAALVALALVPGAGSTVSLTATGVRAGHHPAYLRVVVDFADGDLMRYEPTLLDPEIWKDGSIRLEVAHRGIRTDVRGATVQGVRVEIAQRAGRLVLRLVSEPHRFKYVSYRVLDSPERLAIDLWKSRVPTRVATIRDDGCLRITGYTGGPGVSMTGRELVPLFEHTVVVRLRDRNGKLLGQRPLIAANGRWGTSFTYSVSRPQRATVEAVSESAKDGGLECLVQVPVLLRLG